MMEWAPFTLSELADIGSGRDIYDEERVEGDTPYVTAGTRNNGIGYFIGNTNDTLTSDVIVLNRNGAVGNAFYHPYQVLVSNDCRTVRLHKNVDADCKRFVARTISEQRACFSYSRKLGTARAKKMRIMLPVSDGGEPDWEYMSSFAEQMRGGMLMRYRNYVAGQLSQLECKDIPALDEKVWHEYALEELFSVGAGKRLTNADKIEGNRPFIGATDNSNGITGFVGNSNTSYDKNVLGVNYNGAPCIAFYHPYECIFSDDVKRLHLLHHEDNEYVLLFFKAIVMQQQTKYSYGYKFKEKRMLRQKLMIPVDDDGKPDYAYMEQYAKNMMVRKYQQYLAYLDAGSDEE